MNRPGRCAVVAVAGDVVDFEALPGLHAARPPVFVLDDLATIAAAAADLSADVVRIEAGDGRTRVFIREADCLVSVAGPELDDVRSAVETCRALALECRTAAGAAGA